MPCGRASTPAARSRLPPAARRGGRPRRRRKRRRAADLVALSSPSGVEERSMANPTQNAPLHGTVAFAGRLASMRREEAFALVQQQGGTPRRGVTRKTGVLIVGELGWPLLANGQPSKSLALAKSYGVPIVSERRFLEWAGKAERQEHLRSYSRDQIASLSGLPPDVVDQLTVFGLLDCLDDH